MNKSKRFLTTMTMMAILLAGVISTNAGILMTDGYKSQTPQTCTEEKVDNGVIVTGLVGVIVTGFTGVIVTGFTGVIVTGAMETSTDCGVIVTD
jgi:hypothetical protein